MRRLYWLLRRLFQRERYRLELNAELSATLELLVAEMHETGMSERDARAAAMRELGSIHTIGEETRDAWAGAGIERFARDVRHALRGLRRNPGFALATIVTFALAIGGTTTVGTLVDFLLLQPLPFAHSDRLMMVLQRSEGSTGGGHVASQPNIADWQ